MSFGKMVELLQRKDKGKIILVNSGNFYIARGKDAELNTQRIYLRIMKNIIDIYTKLFSYLL